MKWTFAIKTALLAATFGLAAGSAQPPAPPMPGTPPVLVEAAVPPDPNAPPPPDAPHLSAEASPTLSAYSRKGTIKAFNIGPNSETNGFILRDGTTVLLPVQMAKQIRTIAREGSRISVTGTALPGRAGRMVINAQIITANGQTFTAPIALPVSPGGPLAPAGVAPPLSLPPSRPRTADPRVGRGNRAAPPSLTGEVTPPPPSVGGQAPPPSPAYGLAPTPPPPDGQQPPPPPGSVPPPKNDR